MRKLEDMAHIQQERWSMETNSEIIQMYWVKKKPLTAAIIPRVKDVEENILIITTK